MITVKVEFTNERVFETDLDIALGEGRPTRPEVKEWLLERIGPQKGSWEGEDWGWYECTRMKLLRDKRLNIFKMTAVHRDFIFADERMAVLFKLTWG